jgi:hypothetical protein
VLVVVRVDVEEAPVFPVKGVLPVVVLPLLRLPFPIGCSSVIAAKAHVPPPANKARTEETATSFAERRIVFSNLEPALAGKDAFMDRVIAAPPAA